MERPDGQGYFPLPLSLEEDCEVLAEFAPCARLATRRGLAALLRGGSLLWVEVAAFFPEA